MPPCSGTRSTSTRPAQARAQREAAGRPIPEQILAGLSPLIFEHINFNGRYPFTRPVLDRPLRDPNAAEDEDI